MRRGDVVVAAAGAGYVGKPRPAVIVQTEGFDHLQSFVVCPFTTEQIPATLCRVQIPPSRENGLQVVSWIMVDKISAIPLSKIGKQIGRLSADDLLSLDRTMITFLGLAA